jgi:hypothetical protein
VPADITVRRADLAEADLVGALTERVYRHGLIADLDTNRGFGQASLPDEHADPVQDAA